MLGLSGDQLPPEAVKGPTLSHLISMNSGALKRVCMNNKRHSYYSGNFKVLRNSVLESKTMTKYTSYCTTDPLRAFPFCIQRFIYTHPHPFQ